MWVVQGEVFFRYLEDVDLVEKVRDNEVIRVHELFYVRDAFASIYRV
jgi:hypothetical protein